MSPTPICTAKVKKPLYTKDFQPFFNDKKKTVGRYDCINLLFLIWSGLREQKKTVNNCFYRSECAETRSNGSEAYLTSRTTMFQALGPENPKGSWWVDAPIRSEQKPYHFGYGFFTLCNKTLVNTMNYRKQQLCIVLTTCLFNGHYDRRSCACRSRDLHNYDPHRCAHGRGGRT